jgi:uncharacterized protein YwlG (UPF0340 family)
MLTIGAKDKASFWVPKRCEKKIAIRIAIEIPVMSDDFRAGTGIAIPDTALVTETAGVRIPVRPLKKKTHLSDLKSGNA